MEMIEREQVENVVKEFFEGISALDYDRIAKQTTKGFQLLEHGEVWTLDSLVDVLKGAESVLLGRINTFDFIEYKQLGDMAWISYWNRASPGHEYLSPTDLFGRTAIITDSAGHTA